MKGTIHRYLARFALLCIAVILGAIAVAQAQRGLDAERSNNSTNLAKQSTATPPTTPLAPIPPHAGIEPGNVAELADPSIENVQSPDWAATADHADLDNNAGQPSSFAPAASTQFAAADEDDGSYVTAVPSVDSDYERGSSRTIQVAAAEPNDYDIGELQPPLDIPPADPGPNELPDEAFDQPVPADTGFDPAPPAAAPEVDQTPLPLDEQPLPPFSSTTEEPVADSTAYPDTPAYVDEPQPADFDTRAPAASLSDTSPPVAAMGEPAARTRFIGAQNTVADPGVAAQVDPSAGASGTGKPGPLELEGPQTPALTVTKKVPQEIQVGKPAEFKVTVRNVGKISAHDVLIRDEVPFGTELIDTSPPAGTAADGAILWQMGTIKPGSESTVTMRLNPHAEGEIGSVATVSFQTSASAKTLCTRPQLVAEHTGPQQVLVGDDVVFSIKLTNPGSGVAANVVVQEDVPEGLRHSAGQELEYAVGDIRPGETRLLELTLKADKPGTVENVLYARADANLEAEHTYAFEVVAPLLQVGVRGPGRRFLNREATFDVVVANPGTARARDVELVGHLPRGLKFVGTNNAGQYNPQEHAVHWSLTELPANEMGKIQLTVLPTDMGEQKIRVEGTAQMNLSSSAEHLVTVDGLAALLFTVKDLSDPVEVGGQTIYEIKVVNQGSKTATNLQLAARIPAGMQPVNGEGPTRGDVSGQDLTFSPLARLAPKGEAVYRIHVKALQPGDMRILVQVKSDEVRDPVSKEESTHIYSDE